MSLNIFIELLEILATGSEKEKRLIPKDILNRIGYCEENLEIDTMPTLNVALDFSKYKFNESVLPSVLKKHRKIRREEHQ